MLCTHFLKISFLIFSILHWPYVHLQQIKIQCCEANNYTYYTKIVFISSNNYFKNNFGLLSNSMSMRVYGHNIF
jgi:hypothetical protein